MFFVMLNHPGFEVHALPLVRADANDAGDIAFFETAEEAFDAAHGKTVSEFMLPQIAVAYEQGEMPKMLPDLR